MPTVLWSQLGGRYEEVDGSSWRWTTPGERVRLRLMDGVKVSTTEDSIWLRGPSRDGSAAIERRQLQARNDLQSGRTIELLPLGKLVPHGYLPESTIDTDT